MSNPNRDELQTFCKSVINDLSLWESFLFCLWTCSKFACKIASFTTGVLQGWTFDFLNLGEKQESEVALLGDDSTHHLADVALDDTSTSSRLVNQLDSVKCLIPLLPDDIFREQVWPALMSPMSLPLLLRLRLVSRSWDNFIVTTAEWSDWTSVRPWCPSSFELSRPECYEIELEPQT